MVPNVAKTSKTMPLSSKKLNKTLPHKFSDYLVKIAQVCVHDSETLCHDPPKVNF